MFGNLNLDRLGDPLFEAFVSTGLRPPAELNVLSPTIFDYSKAWHFYDKLAKFSKPDGTSLVQGLIYRQRAGTFDSSRVSRA